MSLTLTESAKVHFTNLIKLQPHPAKKQQLNLRIKTISPGTDDANIELYYCPYGEHHASDIALDCGNFILYIEKTSEPALIDAVIDYKEKLSIKAPYLKNKDITNFSFFDKINDFLIKEVNPILARHGGVVQLLSVNEEDKEIVLQFGGGCKGCSMVDFTLKHSIEKSLKSKFPEIVSIKDITNHTDGQDAFYK